MADWARHGGSGHTVVTLSGGHFSLVERPGETGPLLTHCVREDLARLSAAPPSAQPQASAPTEEPLADLVREILLGGLEGRTPALPTDPTALEAAARAVMSPEGYAYVAGTMRLRRDRPGQPRGLRPCGSWCRGRCAARAGPTPR